MELTRSLVLPVATAVAWECMRVANSARTAQIRLPAITAAMEPRWASLNPVTTAVMERLPPMPAKPVLMVQIRLTARPAAMVVPSVLMNPAEIDGAVTKIKGVRRKTSSKIYRWS